MELNSAAAELSASSDALAATTTQQSAAVTRPTATTEELARASSQTFGTTFRRKTGVICLVQVALRGSKRRYH